MAFFEDFNDFQGSGFAPNPMSGQLDSDAWSIRGLSDGDLNFGGTRTSSRFALGVSQGGVITGGIYGFEVGTNNFILGVQPTGNDFTPGEFILKLQNDGDSTVTEVDVDYIIRYFNDQPRANSLNFSYSEDGSSFTSIDSLDFVTPEAADGSPTWQSTSRSTMISGLSVDPGEFFFLNWTGDDVSGSGSRDEYGIDDIQVTNLVAADGGGNGGGGDPTITPIYDIQGDGTEFTSPAFASPFNNQQVTTQGVVTAIDVSNSLRSDDGGGFFIQDPVGDGNSNTSDGVFVSISRNSPLLEGLEIGNFVQISGTVTERFGQTQIGSVTGLEVIPDQDFDITPIIPIILGQDRVAPTEIVDDAGSTDYNVLRDGLYLQP
jgi:hypothetical protein